MSDIKVKVESDDRKNSLELPKDYTASRWGYRHQQSLILFFTLTIAYSMRSCMGVSLVAMTYHDSEPAAITNLSNVENVNVNNTSNLSNQTLILANSTDDDEVHTQGFFNALMLKPPYPAFKWSKKIQDTVISSFFWGYMSLQIPGGHLAHRFGAKRLLTCAMTINCIASFLFPIAAFYGGWILTAMFRVMQGASQACIFPAMHTFFGKWAPLEERGRLTSLTYGGQALGTVLGLPLTGFISSSPALGWPGIFRFYAVLSGIIAVVVWFLTTDSPAQHPKISAEERKYIEDALGQKSGYDTKQLPVPWSKILKSASVYAIVAAHIGNTWGQVILYTEVPAFMDKIMGIHIKAIGLLTAFPFLIMWFSNFFFSWLTDMMIVKNVMSVTNVRKLASCMGFVPAAVGLVALAYVPRNIYIIEVLLVFICTFKISAHMGFLVNHIDISPNFAGTLMGISNFASNVFSSLAPIISGIILTDVKSDFLWQQVFLMAAGMYFSTNLVYCIFGTAERAEWNEPEKERDEEPAPEETVPMLENSNKAL